MKCQKCNVEMMRVDIPQVQGSKITVWLECPRCHFRTQQQQ